MPVRNRAPHFVTLALAAVLASPLAGCATLRQQNDVRPHPVTITINNNLSLPSDLTIYAVSTTGGAQILGSARPADSTSFQMTPRNFSEPYRLLARTPSGARIWSEQYTVRDATTGEIRWTLVPNILSFFDMPDDSSTTTSTPTKP